MFIPGPSFVPLMSTGDISDLFPDFSELTSVRGGVAVFGAAAAYALVWELGSLRLKSPGPKTLWSTNRDGKNAILTRQAPKGYVTPYYDGFIYIIEQELEKVEFVGSAHTIKLRIEVAVDNASQRIAKLIALSAPVDTGALQSSIELVDSDDTSTLGSSNFESDSTVIL